MNSLSVIALANVVVWGLIVGLMFRLGAGERDLLADLAELEKRLGDN